MSIKNLTLYPYLVHIYICETCGHAQGTALTFKFRSGALVLEADLLGRHYEYLDALAVLLLMVGFAFAFERSFQVHAQLHF